MALASISKDQVVSQLDTGTKWSGSTITYSFPTSKSGTYTSGGYGASFKALNSTQQATAELALRLWDDLITPDMQKTSAQSSWNSSNIEFGLSADIGYAYGYYPSVGTVWLDSDRVTGDNSLVNPVVGTYGFQTYMHEAGHALGLDHMGDYDGSGATPQSYQDSTVYSIMSYFGPNRGKGDGQVAWADWVGADGKLYSPQTPMVNDILAIQKIYGAETTTRTGNTTYGFNSNITDTTAKVYNFTKNLNPILTLYDSGGVDTLDVSGWNSPSVIDLNPGAYSSVNYMTNNIGIAYSANIENAVGGGGADKITGNALANNLSGGAGDDILRGGAGNDTIDGGTGNDTAYLNTTWANVSYAYDKSTGYLTVTSKSGEIDKFKNVEFLIDSANVKKSVDTLTGTSTSGGTGSTGGSGSTGSTTPPTTSDDSKTEESTPAPAPSGDITGTSGNDRLVGNSAANVMRGLAGSDSISGGAGNDTLYGDAGNDTLNGDAGADTMYGGAGNDTYIVDNVGDKVSELNSSGGDSGGSDLVKASVSYTLANYVEKLALTGTGSINGTGNELANAITGNDGANVLRGLGGNDTLAGGAGNDTLYGDAGNDGLNGGTGADMMYGGAGNDTYVVDNVGDKVSELNSSGGDSGGSDQVNASVSFTLTDYVEKLTLTGSGNIDGTGSAQANTLIGNTGANKLFGLGGNDVLSGGAGNDLLVGGAGADTLTGGAGVDTFRFDIRESAANRDTITDFVHDTDRIEISRSAFTAFSGDAAGALKASDFTTGTAAKTADQHLIYNQSTGSLYYDADGAGGAAHVLIALLPNKPVLDAGDFFLI